LFTYFECTFGIEHAAEVGEFTAMARLGDADADRVATAAMGADAFRIPCDFVDGDWTISISTLDVWMVAADSGAALALSFGFTNNAFSENAGD
jgi:hypothetical protein